MNDRGRDGRRPVTFPWEKMWDESGDDRPLRLAFSCGLPVPTSKTSATGRRSTPTNATDEGPGDARAEGSSGYTPPAASGDEEQRFELQAATIHLVQLAGVIGANLSAEAYASLLRNSQLALEGIEAVCDVLCEVLDEPTVVQAASRLRGGLAQAVDYAISLDDPIPPCSAPDCEEG